MSKTLLLATLLVAGALASCGANLDLPGLQTGAASFAVTSQASDITTATYDHNFVAPFAAAPSVAYTLQSFETQSISFSEWSVHTQQLTNTRLTVAFRHQPVHWSSLRVGFWAGARPDIVLGASSFQLGSLRNASRFVQVPFAVALSNPSTFIARAFITGYTAQSGTEIFIRAFDRNISASRLELGIQVGGTMEISSVRVNYIVFSPTTAGFASYGGGITEANLNQIKVHNLQRTIHTSPYVFFGVSNLRHNQTTGISLDSAISSDFYLQISSRKPVQQLFLSYIVVGVPGSSVCGACPNTFISGASCVTACPSNSFVVTYRDGSRGCRECPSAYGFVINDVRDNCTCRSGSTLRSGQCTPFVSEGVTAAIVSKESLTVRPVPLPVALPINTKPANNTIIVSGPVPSPTPAVIPTPISTPIPIPQPAQSFIPSPPPSQVIPPAFNNTSSGNSFPGQSGPAQSFVPSVPSPQWPQQNPPAATPTPVQSVAGNCSALANTYWTGYRCACRVGFREQNGFCVANTLTLPNENIFRPAEFIYKISRFYPSGNGTCTRRNEIFNGRVCECDRGFQRDSNGNCVATGGQCPDNSVLAFGQCICNNGFEMRNNRCVPRNNTSQCNDPNAFLNSLGQCVCRNGFARGRSGMCQPTTVCPPYSSADQAGNCVCFPGYVKYDNVFCSLCPAGQVQVGGRCVVTCGVNEVVNEQTGRCECRSGFAIYQGVCNICPRNFFATNGFCVTCPLFSEYSERERRCVCTAGMTLSNGVCTDMCTQVNEVFNPSLGKCTCFVGLGRVNGVCQICTNGFVDPTTGNCVAGCRTNEIFQNGRCVCRTGFGLSQSGQCTDCSLTPGGFARDGFCVVCPGNQVSINNECRCPPGQRLEGVNCVNNCPSGQLLDANGFCYSCPLNEEPVSGACQCRSGYQRVNGVCQIQCRPNEVIINQRCATCVLGTSYDPVLRACVCPPGSYMSSQMICIPLVNPTTCPAGTFLGPNNVCTPCPSGCAECSADRCSRCSEDGFYPSGSQCQPRCGDGIRVSQEVCDDGNLFNQDGCSNTCLVENGFTCSGNRPSRCAPNPNPVVPVCGDGVVNGQEQCDDRNSLSGDGCFNCQVEPGWTCNSSGCVRIPVVNTNLTQVGDVNFNFNNVFIVLQTANAYPNLTEFERRNFIKYTFPDRTTEPTSVYCIQNASTKNRFECLLVYASGLPNKVYSVNFNFSYQGDTGSLVVNVDPLKSAIRTRSLK